MKFFTGKTNHNKNSNHPKESNKKLVSDNRLILLAIIPLGLFWAFYKIEKLQKFTILVLISIGVSVASFYILDSVVMLLVTFKMMFFIEIIYLRIWADEWNQSINDNTQTNSLKNKVSLPECCPKCHSTSFDRIWGCSIPDDYIPNKSCNRCRHQW
mgnify:CR=1 FL=1